MITIRPMRLDDTPLVAEIENRVVVAPWPESLFKDCIRVGYHTFVLDDNGTAVGYGLLSIAADEGHVLNLGVKPELQGKGLGNMMINYLLDLARREKAKSIYLEVRVSNQIAINLYKKLNFKEISRRKAYYQNGEGREDAIVFSLKLTDDDNQQVD